MMSVVLVPVQYMLALQFICVLPDVSTFSQGVSCLNVIKSEQLVVLVAHVIQPKVGRRAVAGRSQHHLALDLQHASVCA